MKENISNIDRNNNFDFLRFLFAFSVMIGHFRILSGNSFVYWPISEYLAVGGFFVISGFLVTNSFYNNSKSIKKYSIKRAKRIIPAYFFVVILAAIGLVFLSNETIIQYYTANKFWTYLISNITFLNFLQPELPINFLNANSNVVNASLWTIKIEIIFYIIVPIIVIKIKNKNTFLIITYIISSIFVIIIGHLYDVYGNNIFAILQRQFIGQLRFFVSGMLIIYNFDKFKKIKNITTPISLIILIITIIFHNSITILIYPIALAFTTIGIAFIKIPKLNNFACFGDFSYGIYLFHFPIIQIVIMLTKNQFNWSIQLILSVTLTIMLAVFSWNFIEKRFIMSSKTSKK